MNRYWFVCALICIFSKIDAQYRFEIKVLSSDKEVLTSASVQVTSVLKTFAGISDQSGVCRFQVSGGKYTFHIRHLGFEDYQDSVYITRDFYTEIRLKPKSIQEKEVTIYGKSSDLNVKSGETGVTSIQSREIKSLPKLIGESDAIKVLQYTPGVALTGEGNSGLYVRGGANDQNLVLLDGATIFNSAHLLGIFSVFNTDILEHVTLYKSSIPAFYGGRISSVLDIETIEGNNQKLECTGSVGLISSRFMVSGPLVKGKSSFYLSARKCYLNTLIKPLSKIIVKESNLMFRDLSYDFYDLNGGFGFRLSEKDNLTCSFYHGNDLFGLDKQELMLQNSIGWENTAVSLQWKHAFNSSTFLNATVSCSWYNFDFNTIQNQSSFKLNSNIWQVNGRIQCVKLIEKHRISAGMEFIRMNTNPQDRKADIDQVDLNFDFHNIYRTEQFAAFINDEVDINSRLKINLGFRQSMYVLNGPYKVYSYNSQDQITDSTVYSRNQHVVSYFYPEVRMSARYMLKQDLSLKMSMNTAVQYLNQVTTSTVSLPSDFWVPSTPSLKPQYGTQVTMGIYKNFSENAWESSAEVFYKTMNHQLEFYNSIFNTRKVADFEDNFILGTGKAFGAEIFLKKKKGKTTGWVSYTLSRTLRKFDEINNGSWFPAKYDRTHDASIVITHTLNKKWSFSAVFVYATGEAFTVPVARYIIQGNVLNQYGSYNGFRLPDYHRLDLSATMHLKQTKRIHSELTFSVYNVYNRQNPIFLYNSMRGNLDKYELNVSLQQLSLLPVLPSVSWDFGF